MIKAILAIALLIFGTSALYLAAPHQQLLSVAAPRILGLSGGLAIIAALIILLTIMGPATAVFTTFIALMLLWSIPPVMIAWVRFKQKGRAR